MRETAVIIMGLAVVALLTAIIYQNQRRFHRPLITTQYQAVVLNNGDVFYGRIDHLGSDHPVLRDVFTVRQEVNPAPGQPRYTLAKRKDEPNGADHIIIPVTAIAFVEPVTPGSAIGKLIQQTGSK